MKLLLEKAPFPGDKVEVAFGERPRPCELDDGREVDNSELFPESSAEADSYIEEDIHLIKLNHPACN